MSRKHFATGAVALGVGIVIGLAGTAWTEGRHPHLVSAQKSLATAERQLREASHHYGGHRARAIELTQQARIEVRDALEYARTHSGELK